MKTLPIPNPHRALLLTALVLLILAASLAGFSAYKPVAFSEIPEIAARASVANIPPAKVSTLPFSMEDIVMFLSGNFQMLPVKRQPDHVEFVYSEPRADGTLEEIMRIAVSTHGEEVRVKFSFQEFNAMHYVGELIESPFFTRAESEQLYALLYAPDEKRTWQQVGRFQARAALVYKPKEIEAHFEFTGYLPRD
jgi:hypothetical protein